MKRFFFPLLSVFSCVACSGAETGPTGEKESKLKTESAFCREWAIAACNEQVTSACNGTRTGCIDTQKSACQVVVPPGYDPTHAQECLDAVKSAYADAELSAEELDVLLKLGGACSTLIDGGIPEGGACADTFECDGVSGFECVIKPGELAGACEKPVEAAGGDPCSDPEVVCADGYYCNGSDCLRQKALNTACTSDAMCAADLRCDIPTGTENGICVARLPNGDACTADGQCQSGVCIGSTDTDKICVSSIILTVRDPLCSQLR